MNENGKLPQNNPAIEAPSQEPLIDGTGFFADPEVFRALRDEILPRIMAGKPPGDPIRIWVPGCATGEDAYSIAICLLEYLGEWVSNGPIGIFATDIDEAAIAIARAGLYAQDKLGEIPQHLLRFFKRFNDHYRVNAQVRGVCVFARQDVRKDPAFSKLDLIRCRNLLGSLEPMHGAQVLATFHRALKDSGFLMLEGSGDPRKSTELFTIADNSGKFLVKNIRIPPNQKILAQSATVTRETGPGPHLKNETDRLGSELAGLQNELARTGKHLDIAIRERDLTREELKRTKEKALSDSGQLQTVNEELQASNEELLSINEQLTNVNGELERRSADLSRLADDLSNVLSAVDIPILILDKAATIRRFTEPAQDLFGLLPADIGRPITHFRFGLDIPKLEQVVSTVIETGRETSRELQRKGRWYSLRVRPFRTEGDWVDGVVMAWVDIDEIKQNQRALQKERNFVSAVLDAARDLLVLVLDKEGRIVHFNRVCQVVTGYSPEEVQGRPMWDFLLVAEEGANLRTNIKDATVWHHENHWVTKAGTAVLIGWTISPVLGEDGVVESVIATGIDQTMRAEAQARAQESAATVQALLETAAQAIVAVNREGRIILANAATEKMFGSSRQELLGQPVEELIPIHLRAQHTVHRARWFSQPTNRPMGAGVELTGLRRDGTEFPIEVSLSYLHNRQGILGVSFISDITERRKNEEAVLDSRRQLQRLAASLISAQETENRELARELHDVFSQELAVLSMEISAMLQSAGAASPLTPRLRDLGKKMGRLAQEIHRTSRQLHPSILEELGLEAALREECETFAQHSGIEVQFTATNVTDALSEEVALCLYRIAQESLHNVRKHSGARDVHVQLTAGESGIILRVEDGGDGFDPDKTSKRAGLGLISMEERARLVNGRFTIHSQPARGTTVEVFIPLNTKPDVENLI